MNGAVRLPSGKNPERERQLRTIRHRLGELQARLVEVRKSTLSLAERESERRLTADETRQARALRWESEHLRHELLVLREHFERLMGLPADNQPGA